MATKLLTAAALVLGLSFSSVAFAGTPKTDAKTDAKAPAKVEAATPAKTDAKTQDPQLYYWFDANNDNYIGHSESSGCLNENQEACALGYEAVDNPSVPVKPTGAANKTETDRDE